MNYADTLVEVAEDSPVSRAQVPKSVGGRRTKAVVEYELLVAHPYEYTEEDVALETRAALHEFSDAERERERQELRAKGHPHLRVSPLAKRFGWGFHNDARGRIALVAVESPEYTRLVNDPHTAKVRAFRSSRPSLKPR